MKVFPAHAGVILKLLSSKLTLNSISRTCGGDPILTSDENSVIIVFPAHAGVIPRKETTVITLACISRTCGGDPELSEQDFYPGEYFPHMRG